MRQRKRGACVRTARLAVGARLRCGIGAVRSPCWGRAAFGGAEAPMASRNPVEPDLETLPRTANAEIEPEIDSETELEIDTVQS